MYKLISVYMASKFPEFQTGPARAAHRIVPPVGQMSPDLRSGVVILCGEAVRVTPDSMSALNAMFSSGTSRSDLGIDDDIAFLHGFIQATLDRIDAQGKVNSRYLVAAAPRLRGLAAMLTDAAESFEESQR